MNETIELNKKYTKFLGKKVIIGLKNKTEIEGKIDTLDNYFNIVLTTKNGIEMIKGEKIAYISLKE